MRRKTLENNIKSYFKLPSDKISKIISDAGLPPQIRGERLSTEELVRLSQIIKKYLWFYSKLINISY